ncbi:MAG: MFS transporter [Gammaproteobacteria bacterium]|nr:MFS transporter [Gammaproteobacteria bacterium]
MSVARARRSATLRALSGEVWRWAMYDWANSAFALIVMTSFVPLLLREHWSAGETSTEITFIWGSANSIAALLLALAAPLLGALADQGGRRRRMLAICVVPGAICTVMLALPGAGHWATGLSLFVLAWVGYSAANIFYDALLTEVAEPKQYDLVSAYGFALGYIGSAMLFTLCALVTVDPERFGLGSQVQAMQVSMLAVGVWWVLFSVPLLRGGRRTANAARPARLGAAWRQLWSTVRTARRYPQLWLFLLAYFLYIDGVHTIIKMAVDFGAAINLPPSDLVFAILVTNYIGFPATLAFGFAGRRFGPRRCIYVALVIYCLVTLLASMASEAWHFYLLAATIGLAQGGVQSLSRSLFARLAPPEKTTEMFGFYNMFGRFAAILGPVLTGYAALVLGSQRLGVLAILVLLVAGFILLTRVREVPTEA